MNRCSMLACVVAITGAAGSAMAAGSDFTGTFNGIIPQVPITWSVNGGGIFVPGAAGCFSWTKTGGSYAGVSGTFDAFCIELTQTIQEPNSYTYKVVSPVDAPSANGPFTFPLGAVGADQVSELFGRFRPTLNTSDANSCAAFQLAVWEIVYDPNLTINGVGDGLQFGAPAGVLAQAQAYLNAIDGSGPHMPLVAFTNASAQDQIVPVPSTLALLGVAGLVAGRRRR